MAQGTLVTDLIDSGTLLIRQLRLGGFPIAAAWWVKPIEDPLEGNQGWQFFLASSLMDQLGPADAYQKLHDILKNVSFDSVLARIPLGKIKILGETNPITQGVFKIIDQLHGVGPIRAWHRRLGEMRAEEIFIYALNLPSPWQRVILKNPVEVNEPSLKQSEALNQIMASGNPPVLAGWPKSSIPPGTEVNALVLGDGTDPNPFMEIQTLDGKRRGIACKSDTEPVQGPPASGCS